MGFSLSGCLKIFLVIFNLSLMIILLCVAIVGIVLRTSNSLILTVFTRSLEFISDYDYGDDIEAVGRFIIQQTSVMSTGLIVVGFIFGFICFLGFIAACYSLDPFLKAYAFIMGIACVAQIIATIVIFSNSGLYTSELIDTASGLIKNYGGTDEAGNYSTAVWDFIMLTGPDCCGINGVKDFVGAPIEPKAPDACCGRTVPCKIADVENMTPQIAGCRKRLDSFAWMTMYILLSFSIVSIIAEAVLVTLAVGAVSTRKASPL